MKSAEERLRSYQPLWENWCYTGEFLGRGGMSSVFEIKHDAYGSTDLCALKMIEVKAAADGTVRIPKDILNEIKIMRSLSDCASIVQYYDDTTREIHNADGGLDGIDILIRMEKLEALNERTRLSENEVLKLANDICNALVCVGKKNIIHRDIKPHNIFKDKSGKYKLGDFGISKIISELSVNFTREIGTQAYVAPEIFSGNEINAYDASTDVYSLGLVLYAFLNDNRLPFEEEEASIGKAIARRLGGETFPEPKNGNKELKRIIMKAASFDRRSRFKDAEEMLAALSELDKPKNEGYIKDPYMTVAANDDEDDSGVVYYNPAKPRKTGVIGDSRSDIKHETGGKSTGGLKISGGLAGRGAASEKTAVKAKVTTSGLKFAKSFSTDSEKTEDMPREKMPKPTTTSSRFKKPTREL